MDYLMPPARPVQGPGGLLAAADTPAARLTRTFAGVGFRAGACTGWRVYDPCGEGGTVDHSAAVEGETVQGQPFPIQVEDDCPSTFGPVTVEERVTSARERLTRIESAAIAREFWTGELADAAGWADNARLAADGDVTVVAGGSGAVSITAGLAELDQALADATAGAPGALHMTRAALVWLAKAGPAPRREGNLLLTLTDHRVIADAGYPGTAPDGSTPASGEAWIYATTRPTVWRSDVFVTPPEMDRDINSMRASAEEYALTTITCGVYAARITLA